jgi:hypothetical protein
MDNYATHKRPDVKAWLAVNPRIQAHFVPTSGSWLNLVEVWFGSSTGKPSAAAPCGSVKDLNTKIRAFIDSWNAYRGRPSSGPKRPRRYSARPTVQRLQRCDTSSP